MHPQNPGSLDVTLIRSLASSVEEKPEVIDLLIDMRNCMEWISNPRNAALGSSERGGTRP